jgi:hypothetical protein
LRTSLGRGYGKLLVRLLTTNARLLGLSSVVATSVLSSIGVFVASLKKSKRRPLFATSCQFTLVRIKDSNLVFKGVAPPPDEDEQLLT